MEAKRPLPTDFYPKILNEFDERIHSAITVFMVECGLRYSEIEHLKKIDVADVKIGSVFFVDQIKTGKKRRCVLTPRMMAVIDGLPSRSEFLFGDPELPPTNKTYNRKLKRACVSFGLDDAEYASHSLRKCYGRKLRENGVSIESICELYGHSSIAITRMYCGFLEDEHSELIMNVFG